jgi:hypothetical protein
MHKFGKVGFFKKIKYAFEKEKVSLRKHFYVLIDLCIDQNA